MNNWEIRTKYGELVCDNCTFAEAAQCKHELICMDKTDGVYEKGFYIMKRKEAM